jgi:hypothetical protein
MVQRLNFWRHTFTTALAVCLAGAAAAESAGPPYAVPDTPYTRDLNSVAPEDLPATGIYEGSPTWLAEKAAYAEAFYDTLASFKRYLDAEHTRWEVTPIPQEAPPPCDQPQPTRYDAEGCRYINALFQDVEAEDPARTAQLRAAVRRGRDVWFKGTFGDQDFYEVYVADTILLEMPDYSGWLDTRNRDDRFRKYGLINDPDCRPGSEATFWLDDCDDPHATGVLGLRKYFRPATDDYDPATAPYEEGEIKQLKRFSIGFACAVCHVGFDPTNPPEDPANPKWENLMGGIGNQYIQHGKLFTQGKPEAHFVRQVFAAQRPGTIDPTLSANDFIHNPLGITAIINFHRRPLFEQRMRHPITGEIATGQTHIALKGGEDGVGDRLALMRVYVNIGLCALECWTPNFPEPGALFSNATQTPFRVKQCYQDCEPWNHAEAKIDGRPDLSRQGDRCRWHAGQSVHRRCAGAGRPQGVHRDLHRMPHHEAATRAGRPGRRGHAAGLLQGAHLRRVPQLAARVRPGVRRVRGVRRIPRPGDRRAEAVRCGRAGLARRRPPHPL